MKYREYGGRDCFVYKSGNRWYIGSRPDSGRPSFGNTPMFYLHPDGAWDWLPYGAGFRTKRLAENFVDGLIEEERAIDEECSSMAAETLTCK